MHTERALTQRKFLTIILAFTLIASSQLSCSQSPKKAAEETSNKPIAKTDTAAPQTTKTAKELARERGHAFSTQTEAMDYFFRTFFSGNLETAYNATSINYRNNPPTPNLMNEWRSFYGKAAKYRLNWENLSYRTNFSEDNSPGGGISHYGVIISPSGRIIMAVYFSQLNNGYWQIENLLMQDKALPVKSDNGLERAILTNKTKDKTYLAIQDVIIKDVIQRSELQASDTSIIYLVVSDGWARALLKVNKPGFETEQIILQNIGGGWKLITYGTGTTFAQHPESPFLIWAPENYK